jgi:ABC-type antimicrobial peptide transport system permease subunit
VIAVVGDERHVGVDAEATPSFFIPFRQVPNVRDLAVIVRSSSDTTPALREIVRRIDPEMPLFQVRTMAQVIDTSVAAPRSMAWLLSAFAASALMLAAIGVFGVMSHSVSQRTREIGVRMALGASPSSLVRQVAGHGLKPVSAGLVAGVAGAMAVSGMLQGQLFQVSPRDPLTLALVVVLLLAVALLAALVPARRATRIDPATALHEW